ncbi:uncharacterized protein N7496_009931 [Penicillium cataractarum]|uniref:HNH nuclease domain-containing protein n=1 Tax=Penicillium cataractarum TaxID=2100454 RepID=A0A9W9RPW2_9EURO|nr:uncharacterized protein N7496_009931 [Penicillium cataractarum]KAJ5364218.1 hypothetical protein N7496_009931 [Penicillium cataractarum]
MSQIPEIPPRVYARMPKRWQEAVDEKREKSRSVSSGATPNYRSVSDFLEAKVQAHGCELDYIETAYQGLQHTFDSEQLSPEEFRTAIGPFLSSTKRANEQLGTICKQRKILEEDIEESVATKRPRHGEISLETLERAYSSSLTERVMAARAKQPGRQQPFSARNFKKAVNDYYGINAKNGIESEAGYCHVLGKFDAKDIKAAHVVPKSLSTDEIAPLFGVRQLVAKDPRNAVSLHKSLEGGLDSGKIDIHERELRFLNDNRPAKRFLYFRFIITYIFRKREDSPGSRLFTDQVESEKAFWPSPGEYLEKSTLKALARNISGCELPASLTAHTTFESSGELSKASDVNAIMRTTQSIIDVISGSIQSTKAREDESQTGTEDAEEDESDDVMYHSCSEY